MLGKNGYFVPRVSSDLEESAGLWRWDQWLEGCWVPQVILSSWGCGRGPWRPEHVVEVLRPGWAQEHSAGPGDGAPHQCPLAQKMSPGPG